MFVLCTLIYLWLLTLQLKVEMPELCNWLPVYVCELFEAKHGFKKRCQIWHRHVWRQKAAKLNTCNHLHNFGFSAFSFILPNSVRGFIHKRSRYSEWEKSWSPGMSWIVRNTLISSKLFNYYWFWVFQWISQMLNISIASININFDRQVLKP